METNMEGAPAAHVRLLPGIPLLPLGAFDAAAVNYSVSEYILSGTAISYKETTVPDATGRWSVAPAGSAAYVTRIVVIRPETSDKFNSSVFVEWLNVTAGLDAGPVWQITRRELLRSGWAYVAVSAQQVGIEGGKTVFGADGKGLKDVDPERYGSLTHPGDAYSFDIFSQVAQLLKRKNAGGVVGNLPVRQVIAVGNSQSAAYLTTYVNAIDPIRRS
jgi:Alpha/beta hydrolase domain